MATRIIGLISHVYPAFQPALVLIWTGTRDVSRRSVHGGSYIGFQGVINAIDNHRRTWLRNVPVLLFYLDDFDHPI